jgi:hypothetical protein
MTRKITVRVASILTGCLAAVAAAQAAPLSIVKVGAPGYNCFFNIACTEVPNDSVGTFNLPADFNSARLQSRTYPGTAPAPAAGDMAYEYRVDLTSVGGSNCVTKLALVFGPVVKLPYLPGARFDVYVVTSGGLGSVGLSSANQVGSTIIFTFAQPVCPGATSYFFGLASKKLSPVAGTAKVFFSLGGSATTADRVP